MLCCRDDFFKQYCKEQSAEELYEQIDLLNRNLVGKCSSRLLPMPAWITVNNNSDRFY